MIGRGFLRVLYNRTETGPTCFPTLSASCSLLDELIDGLVAASENFSYEAGCANQLLYH
jgi:hypothetical protein